MSGAGRSRAGIGMMRSRTFIIWIRMRRLRLWSAFAGRFLCRRCRLGGWGVWNAWRCRRRWCSCGRRSRMCWGWRARGLCWGCLRELRRRGRRGRLWMARLKRRRKRLCDCICEGVYGICGRNTDPYLLHLLSIHYSIAQPHGSSLDMISRIPATSDFPSIGILE